MPRTGLAAALAALLLGAALPSPTAAAPGKSPSAPSPADKGAADKAAAEKRAGQERLRQRQEALAGEVNAVRRESVAAAAALQRREAPVAALVGELAARERDKSEKQRRLDENRAQQGALLGALERLAHDPPDTLVAASATPLDRLRGGLLMAAAVPALEAQARQLKARLDELAAAAAELQAKRSAFAGRRGALGQARELLAGLAAHRLALERRMRPDWQEAAAQAGRLAEQAGDLPELIKRLDAETERRDAGLLAAAVAGSDGNGKQKDKAGAAGHPGALAAADPTRPADLRVLDDARHDMRLPVSGQITRGYADPDEHGTPSEWIGLAALDGAEAVAPFDGRVEYAGPLRGHGRVLIIQHGGGYHSVLAGLGRVEAIAGEWVVAGEPVGALPEDPAGRNSAGASLYFELRREGRPVDPLPLLDEGADGAKQDERTGGK